jgi:hypothetical protein
MTRDELEKTVLAAVFNDPGKLRFAQYTGLWCTKFENQQYGDAYQEIDLGKHGIESAPKFSELAKELRAQRAPPPNIDDLIKTLAASGPSLPLVEEPKAFKEPEKAPATTRQPRKRPPSKEFLQRRINYRTGNLHVLAKHLKIKVETLKERFLPRDVCDPDDAEVGVADCEIGKGLRLTMDRMFAIEDDESAARAKRCRSRFSFRTVQPFDKTPDQVKRERERRNRQRAKAKEKKMQLQAMQEGHRTWAEVRAEQKANIEARDDAILAVLGDGESHTTVALKSELRNRQAWAALAGTPRYHRSICERLDALKQAKRIVDSYSPNPRGGPIRAVRLMSSGPAVLR